MTAFREISYAVADGVCTLTLDRPARLNAVTSVMIDELIAALDQADADDAVRAVIVTGAGRAFCAGGDLGAMSDMPPAPGKGPDPLIAPYRYFGEVLARLNRLPQPLCNSR